MVLLLRHKAGSSKSLRENLIAVEPEKVKSSESETELRG
jgi:hypothetical protein